MVKVYSVRSYCPYEGGGAARSIHASFEGAKAALEKYVQEFNDLWKHCEDATVNTFNPMVITPEDGSLLLYSDGFTNMEVDEYEVQP
jgi:hypothetical protein